MKTRIMISAAVIAAGMLASCSNKEIVDEQPETDGVSASVLNIVPTVGTDTRAGFVPKTEWAVNDAMGLFMYKATGWGTPIRVMTRRTTSPQNSGRMEPGKTRLSSFGQGDDMGVLPIQPGRR